jgi:hypothetical protein
LPVAVVGLRDRENLYVRADGSWESGAYILAYVRRYPFIFLEDRERGQFVLCIDENSDNLSDSEGELLFDGDQPGPAGTRGRDFCTAFQGQVQRAMGVSGFRVIDEAKFNALDDATVLDWRRKGWLPLIYCHLISISNWSNLVDRVPPAEPADRQE